MIRPALSRALRLGVQRLLIESKIDINGAHVVVLGRSMIVGKPLALLLMQKNTNANATVTVVHSRSRDLAEITRSADIIVAAIGRAEFVKADHVREGVVVIDVGINRVDDAANERGYRLVGDVAFDEVSKKASAITPVPGGVGPMTIAMLMSNTVKAAQAIPVAHCSARYPTQPTGFFPYRGLQLGCRDLCSERAKDRRFKLAQLE